MNETQEPVQQLQPAGISLSEAHVVSHCIMACACMPELMMQQDTCRRLHLKQRRYMQS